MTITRRMALAGVATTAGLAAARSMAAASFPVATYGGAVVIDGQGEIDDPDGTVGSARLSPRAVADIRRSGVTAISTTVNEPGNGPDVWNETIANIGRIGRMVDVNRGLLLPVTAAADIRAAKASGRVGIIMNVQDTSLVGAQLDRLATLKGLGVRIVQLTYNLQNLAGDGSLEIANGGLSTLGRATIARIEQERLLLDLSHGGQRTIAEAIAAATRPMVISHTGARALYDHPRNVRDAELKACADKGGVIGVYWMPYLIANGQVTGADLLRHMTYIRDLCGEEHVAIGTDGQIGKTVLDAKFRDTWRKVSESRAKQGVAAPREGPDIFNIIPEWDDEFRFRHLADGLAGAGWSPRQIEKALGTNLLRIYGDAWGG